MRIHSDILTEADIYAAAKAAGDAVHVKMTERGSRKRARAFNVDLTGTSSRAPGHGRGEPGDKAATWDEWGIFLATLFNRDGAATVPGVYESGEHFHWATGNRFLTLRPSEQHDGAGHKWSRAYPNLTGAYMVAECLGRKGHHCSATVRQMAYGHTFAEISDPRDFDGMEGV